MKRAHFARAMVAAFGWCIALNAAETKLPLRVVYLGNQATPRATQFIDFLQTRFEQVAERKRQGVDLDSLAPYDVVVLDWSQADDESERAVSPLGPRDEWSKPTLLLGSAGHLLATPWQTIGGAG